MQEKQMIRINNLENKCFYNMPNFDPEKRYNLMHIPSPAQHIFFFFKVTSVMRVILAGHGGNPLT